jgi:hypothetical protein
MPFCVTHTGASVDPLSDVVFIDPLSIVPSICPRAFQNGTMLKVCSRKFSAVLPSPCLASPESEAYVA